MRKFKSIFTIILLVLFLLSSVYFTDGVPLQIKTNAQSFSDELKDGESYTFDFNKDEVIETAVGKSTSKDSGGNQFTPFMSQCGGGTDTAAQADIDADGDGETETSALKLSLTGWNSVYIPTDKNGLPYELEANTKYSVSIKVYVESKSAYGQLFIGGGVKNQYERASGFHSGGMIYDHNNVYNGGTLSLRTDSSTFATGDYNVKNGKFNLDGKEYLNYLYIYTGINSQKFDGTNTAPSVVYIDSITITKIYSPKKVGYSQTFEFDTVKTVNAKDAEGNAFTPFMSQNGCGTDTATQVNIDTNNDGENETSTLRLSLTGWNSVYIPTDENGFPFVLEPNTKYSVSMKAYVEAKAEYGQFFMGGGVKTQYSRCYSSSGMIYDQSSIYNGGQLSELRTGSSTFTTGNYTVKNGKFTVGDTEYLNYLYIYTGMCNSVFDGTNAAPSVVYIDSVTVTKKSSFVLSDSGNQEIFKESYLSLGDFNNDNEINGTDLVCLKKAILNAKNSNLDKDIYDVNEDKNFNVIDLIRMKKVVSGDMKLIDKKIDTDGKFEYNTVTWSGPEGYSIVVPNGNVNIRETALILQKFYRDKFGKTLEIITDDNVSSQKEILIGATNRTESNCNIEQSDLSVSLKGEKLVFDGGHDVTVDTAVKRFVRLSPPENTAHVFSDTTNFKSTVLDGYEYVWGDEFEGTDIDLSKWALEKKMEGSTEIEVSYDKDIISVEDGKLKLKAIQYENPNRAGTKYRVPYSVATEKNMNYVYGYAEIRARVPYFKGAWPSFWTQTTGYLSGKENKDYMVEVDIFEIFGNTSRVVPNIHKWYTSEYDYGAKHLEKSTGAYHTIWGELEDNKSIWVWQNPENLIYEYHTYGWEWTPSEMSMYVDGKKYMTFDVTKSYDLNKDISGFQDPKFLMFNNHVFTEDSTSIGSLITESLDKLPACYFIDYCRVYQKKDMGELYIDKTVNTYPDR